MLAVATRWVDADPPARKQHLPELLSVVRLGLLPSEALLQPSSPAASAAAGLIQQHIIGSVSGGDLAALASLDSDDGGGLLGRSWGSCGTSPLEGGGMLSWEWELGHRARRSRRYKPSGIVVAGARRCCRRCRTRLPLRWTGGQRGCPPARRPPGRAAGPAGGHEAGWHSLKRVELYDPHGDEWSAGPALPAGLSFATSALLDRDVYVVGGRAVCPALPSPVQPGAQKGPG